MAFTPEALFARLEALGIETRTLTHPPVFTVEEGAALHAQMPGGHCKSLFLKNKKGDVWLVVADHETRIDLKALAKALGAGRLSFGSPARLEAVLGVTPGSVTPFALVNDTEKKIQVILDAAMMRHEVLHYHPLINTMTTAISRDGLRDFIRATGHEAREMALPAPDDA